MKRRKAMILICMIALALCFSGSLRAEESKKDAARKPVIQMAILLDNSGSMSGLIGQAKTQLWKVVNEFATTRKNGQIPTLQVALYTYGNPPPKRILALTTDLDSVSEKLQAVGISGGSEYCGQVIQKAVGQLKWSDSNEDLKVIFIAGNEPFTQGPVDYRKACRAAIRKGIIVNTIHCGGEQAGIDGKWREGATLADGSYMCINQNRTVVHIKAPQDKKIAELGKKLNETYIPYGTAGRAGRKRQAEQDAEAKKLAPAGANLQRAVAKANAHYVNTGWDLVDATANEKVKLEELKEEALPENMRKMSPEERKSYLEENARRRGEIKEQINKLNAARKQFVAKKRKEMSESEEDTLGDALVSALREQAAGRGFEN